MTRALTQRRQHHLRIPTVLTFRDFRLLLGGQAVSRVGNGIYEATLGLMVFSAGSAIAMSVVLIAFVAPQLLLTLKAGVLSDQLNRRHLIIAADAIAAVVAVCVAIAAHGNPNVELLILLSLGIGTAAALFNPAYGPLLSNTVPGEHLARANGLDAAVTNAASLAAPALGGWLYAAGGATLAIGANGASFVAAAVCSGFLRLDPKRERAATDVIEGEHGTPDPGASAAWRWIRISGWLPPLLALALLMNLLVLGPFFVILPWRVTAQHLPPIVLGLAVSMQAGAALAVSLLLGRRPSSRPGRRFVAVAAVLPVALLTLLFVNGALGVLLAAALVGVGMAAGVLENLMLQSWVPDHLRGRVYAFDVLLSLGSIPVGYLLAGILISGGITRTTGSVGALVCLVVALVLGTGKLAHQQLATDSAV
jgi:MFS family permease